MKKLQLAFFLLFTSCAGTTGHIALYQFDNNKYEVQKQILDIINLDSIYAIPEKWSDVGKGDYFERIYIYFKSKPEEIYRIGFIYDSTVWKQSSASTLGLISQFNGDTWRNEDEINNKELMRIKERFESEILAKVKFKFYKID